MSIEKILNWSDRMATAAAAMLRRGGEHEKIELRKLIDEYSEEIEPIAYNKDNL